MDIYLFPSLFPLPRPKMSESSAVGGWPTTTVQGEGSQVPQGREGQGELLVSSLLRNSVVY